MQKLKLTEILESLTPQELKRLGDFIRSPFYNKNKKLVSLYEYIEKSLNILKPDDITKENIWHFIFPGEKYNDSKLRSFLSDFRKLCEKFIIVTEAEKNSIHQKNNLLMSFSQRNLQKNFDVTYKELAKIFKEEFNRNYDYHFNKISTGRILITHKGKNIEVNVDNNFHDLSDSIDHFFLSSKLDLINSFISRKYHALGNTNLNIKFMNEIISFIEENLNEFKKNNFIIYTEYLIFKMMTATGNDKYFNDLHQFVLKNISKYNHSELEQVYYPMINFGFNKVAEGQTGYLNKIFDIYKTFERKGFYMNMKTIQDIDFISIVIAGLRLKKIQWVEKFFENYSYRLTPEYKDDSINLIRALISFKKKDYDTSIRFLNNVNYQNSYYYLKSKETLMQIYYEQKEYEAMQSMIDTTKHYLKRRQNVLSIHYERYLMFLRFVNMLLRAKLKDKDEKIFLIKELKKNKNVIAREWLLEKVDDL